MAAWGSYPNCFQNITGAGDVASIGCLEPLFANVVTAVLSFAGVALFMMLLVGGYNFLFAGPDPKKIEKAKGTLAGAITGLVVIVMAFLILRLIGEVTGLDLTTFKVVIPNN